MRILTFDIEDWFHILDLPSVASPAGWAGQPSRLVQGVERILDLLTEQNARATFFVLGWVAEQHPEVLRRIDDRGFEIGSHSQHHGLVYDMTPVQFREDLKRSTGAIEAVTGKKVRLYRAPGFSITDDCLWAFHELVRQGIEVDCSLFSAPRNHGGVRKIFADTPCIISTDAGSLREFPMNMRSIAGRRIVFSGGGFFRLLPYALIREFTRASSYTMTYFHPRDFDAKQPRLKMSARRRFQAYVGLSRSTDKLRAYLRDFDFCDIAGAEALVNWPAVPRVDLRSVAVAA